MSGFKNKKEKVSENHEGEKYLEITLRIALLSLFYTYISRLRDT